MRVVTDSRAFPALPADLPTGRVIRVPGPDGRRSPREVLWVSDRPCAESGPLWGRLYDQRAATGLYPLLLDGLGSDPGPDVEIRPWHSGELAEFRAASAYDIDALDPALVLRGMWPESEDEESDPTLPDRWPGLADPASGGTDPDVEAAELAYLLSDLTPRLFGLVPAASGADALTLCGWGGPVNHTNVTEEISAVVRSWEQRFGARVILVGFDTLTLSVSAPPTSREHAERIAAEHRAFCPDNFAQSTFDEYAASLIGTGIWSFWWD